MLFRRATSLVTAASLFASCAVGPNYRRPRVGSPGKFRHQTTVSHESIADLPWWKVFQDRVLQELIAEALKNNFDLRIAVTRIAQARAQRMQTRSSFYPQLRYSADASRGRDRETTIPSQKGKPTRVPTPAGDLVLPAVDTPEFRVNGDTESLLQFTGNTAWELDLWGRIRRADEAALARLLATDEARRGVVQSLVSSVAQTYFRLRELDLELEIAKRTTVSFGQSLDLFGKQQRGGLASELEISRATAAQANAAATVPDIERRSSVTENQLSILLGRNPGAVRRGLKLLDQQLLPSVPAGIPAALLERRPDLRQAEESLIAANAQIGEAVADFLPRVSLTGALGVVSPQLSQLASGDQRVWNIGASLTAPVFQGGRLIGNLRESRAAWEEAKLQYQRAALNAFGEVANALVAREKYAAQRVQLERQVTALQQSVVLSRQRFTEGVSGYFELLEAQQQLFPAERILAQARLNQLLSLVQLYEALGGGWKE